VEVQHLEYKGAKTDRKTRKTTYIFTCKLKDLEAGTTYAYEVISGDEKSAVNHFSTIPAKTDKFRFVVYTDSHAGQYGIFEKINALVVKEKPAFIVNAGDLINSGEKNFSEWGSFLKGGEKVFKNVPFWPTMGNHDGYGSWASYRQVLDLPNNELWYSFDYGNTHFVSLCSYPGKSDAEMFKWCEEDLANSKAFWKIVFLHEPAFASAFRQCMWGWKKYLRMFEKHGVNIYIGGHLHIYQRFYPLYMPGSSPKSAITYLILGETGGKKRNDYPRPEVAFTKSKISTYTVFDIDGAKLSAKGIDIKGEKVDEFSITRKTDGSYDEKYLAAAKDAQGLIVHRLFNNKGYTDAIPEEDTPHIVFFSFGGGKELGLEGKIDVEISVDEKSQTHYVLQPEVITQTLDAAGNNQIRIPILRKKGAIVSLHKRGWFQPPLRIKFKYKTAHASGSAIGSVKFAEKKWW
jgi:calcineurin-like phosphoesterase family protein